ncbi:LysR family transcriptional regulator [Roseomonas marmotae]|uniref:LysR family transcriptional regulator n=1 Tax=Roseomonas marmotae TaxID=2768161 RepID=A0ABS3K732_9PROT|nr:LysR substrate-binding domain-containing protein [Roseomonas marmotae]MBO1073245.1 LysR family transcriptional regulator [Roseomonas marmotae]QTI79131.1 LysR family transcriptional regulator [Roseomonas marmotae]
MATRRYLDQRLKLHHLRAVEAIVAQHSLLKASAALGITQPALSKTLQELEDILQQRLFDRLPRGMRPTEAGELFVQSSRRILAEIRRLDEELDRLAGPDGGTVALGTLPVAATGVLPGALTLLKAQHPHLRVRLEQGRTEDLLPKLASGEIDMIVGRLYEPALPDGFLREPLWEEPISVLARIDHPIFRLPRIPVDALRHYDLVLPTVSQRVGQEIDAFLALLALTPASSLRSSSYGFIREMLHGTDMISAMPRLMMAGDLLRGTLRVVPLAAKAARRPAGIILPPNRPLPPAGHAFVTALRAHIAEIGERGLASITNGYKSAGESNKTRRPRGV